MMDVFRSAVTLVIVWLCCSVIGKVAVGQQKDNPADKGNEDSEMFNYPALRDSLAIADAEQGWWLSAKASRNERIKWWQEATYGMFIHWGIYAMTGNVWKGSKGGGYAEHIMRVKKIPRAEYLTYASDFNPVDFDADAWADYAKRAGMGYLIITAKHHDGFAMYPTTIASEYSISSTAFRRDPMAELAEACRRRGIRFGFYYSHAFDWEHPDAPGNDWDYDNPGGDRLLGGKNWFDQHPEWLPKVINYVDSKSIPQILELIERYQPDILWFDTPHKLPLSENLRILKTIREAAPDVVVNGRLARTGRRNYGDYLNTADRPVEFAPVKAGENWEAIPTTNESYGYSSTDLSHKTAAFQIRLLAKAVSRGGNLLLNIGPMGNGAFDSRDTQILDSIALWMEKNKASVIGAEASPLPLQNWGVVTQKRDTLYLHVFDQPTDRMLFVGGLLSGVKDAHVLGSGEPLNVTPCEGGVEIEVGVRPSTESDLVIALTLSEPLRCGSERFLSTNIAENRLLAFDATLHGQGFTFGDGKAERYYVAGWQSVRQSISWEFRLRNTGRYRLLLDHVSDSDVSKKGVFELRIGEYIKTVSMENSQPTKERQTIDLGEVTLAEGLSTLSLHAIKIMPKSELMKLLEVRLIPLN